MRPQVEMTIDGAPIAAAFYSRLVSLTVTDREGVRADTFEAELSDGDPDFLAIPRKGALVSIRMGYAGGLREMGTFTVDEVAGECLPFRLRISGKSADLRSGKLKETRERHFDDKTLGEIVEQLAGENGLSAVVSPAIGAHVYKWLGQQDESAIAFLERLARRHNALFTIKAGRLLFAEKGSGLAASGAALGTVLVERSMIVPGTCRFELPDRTKYARVVAYYHDRDQARRIEIEVAGDEDGEAVLRLPDTFADAAEADQAASAKAKDLKRGEGSTAVTIAGDTGAAAGAPLIYRGVRPGLDGVPWVIESAAHSFRKVEGYRTAITAKLYDGKSAAADSSSGSGAGDQVAAPGEDGGSSTGTTGQAAGTPPAPAAWGSTRRTAGRTDDN